MSASARCRGAAAIGVGGGIGTVRAGVCDFTNCIRAITVAAGTRIRSDSPISLRFRETEPEPGCSTFDSPDVVFVVRNVVLDAVVIVAGSFDASLRRCALRRQYKTMITSTAKG